MGDTDDMNDALALGLACAIGVVLGAFYFGTLWLVVRRLPRVSAPALLLGVTGLARLAVVVAGFYVLEQSAMIVRVAAVLAGMAAGAVVFWKSAPGGRFYVFSQESAAETRKVVWPTRKETLQTTGIVFAFMVVMALFLWIVDASLLWAVKMLLGQSG